MTGYLPLIFMATTTFALIYVGLTLNSHSQDIAQLQADHDHHDKKTTRAFDGVYDEIDNAQARIDWLAGYPDPPLDEPRNPDPPETQPIKERGRHRQ